MPRLLIVTTIPGMLRAFLLPLARHFATQGWQVDAMAHGLSECAECRATFQHVWDVDWTRNPLKLCNLQVAPRQVRTIVEDAGYDLVHVHTPVAAFVTRLALRRLRRRGRPKVIYTAHGFHFHSGGSPLKNAAFLALEALAGRWTDELVVINREDDAAARRHRIVPPEHVHFMPGIGVDTGRYDPAKVADADVAGVRAALGLVADVPLFLVVGEFIPRKRHQDALRAFATLSDRRAHLALAGDGPLREPLRRLTAELGLGGRVHFLGFRRNIPALVRASSAVILVSAQEGLPRCVMEALSLEVPVIGSDIRGTHELLADGCGLLVPTGDVPRLVEAMMYVLNDPEEARAMGRRGRAKMRAGFGLDAILRRHDELYAQTLGAQSSEDLNPVYLQQYRSGGLFRF